MGRRYIALVDGKRGAYGVVFPDLPGCTAMGETIEEALRNASEAASDWAAAVCATNEGKLPAPRSSEALRKDTEIALALAGGAALAVVPLIIDSGRAAKANLSLDRGLLAAIDEAAHARGVTRSAFLAAAAREKIITEG